MLSAVFKILPRVKVDKHALGRRYLQLPSIRHNDTIYALSSGPLLKTGIAVVRISGSLSEKCMRSLIGANASIPIPRRASLRRIMCPVTNELLDHCVILWFPGPKSYTGEDMVELHVHGSRAVVDGLFTSFESLNESFQDGQRLRPAEKGEFTKRAYDNGRMDLTEIEGIGDLLCADTSEQRKQALRQMEGHMRRTYESWRDELKSCLAHCEAVIDFGDDDRENDINDEAMWALVPRVTELLKVVRIHLRDAHRGEIVREGVRVALVGLPNAGKSSLMNALTKRPTAIVSPVAGTTRDVVEVRMDLGGISCIVSDTAGLRADPQAADEIEREGIRRAGEVFTSAHVKVLVVDASDPTCVESTRKLSSSLLSGESTHHDETETAELVVLNKTDLGAVEVGDWGQRVRFGISCRTGEGLDALEKGLAEAVKRAVYGDSSGSGIQEGALITRQRHRTHIRNCAEHLERFLLQDLPMDMAAEELRLAMREIGKLTGAVEVEDLLDVIFRDFCIGK